MASLYPQNLDSFRAWLDSLDMMIAGDLADLFDAIVAIETELGIQPSGAMGTIYGRLFASGNINERTGLWRPIYWRSHEDGFQRGTTFNRGSELGGFTIAIDRQPFRGQDTVFGEGFPVPFGALQFPLVSPQGAVQRAGCPWRSNLTVVEGQQVSWVGLGGERDELSSSTVTTIIWGQWLWNMIT